VEPEPALDDVGGVAIDLGRDRLVGRHVAFLLHQHANGDDVGGVAADLLYPMSTPVTPGLASRSASTCSLTRRRSGLMSMARLLRTWLSEG
jgi:hypothetical protein